ncbi:MAG: DUF1073 domain-containing protein [Elusimicrobiota bacterium]|jgi:hypothetical protein|nr:DUF1073 domain-containing protein [Elusimicrobiota bacterium]
MPTIAGVVDNAIGFITRRQNTEVQYIFDNPFAFPIEERSFIHQRVKLLYAKILKDCFAASAGIPDKAKPLFWDTVVKSFGKSNAGDGLISLLSGAMADKKDLFLVYNKDVLRIAKDEEKQTIKESFEKGKKQNIGFWFSFSDYFLSDILRVLFSLQLAVLSSTYTGMNVSKSLFIQMDKLRELVSREESAPIEAQAKKINEGIKSSKSILIDALDKVTTINIDMTSTKTSIDYIWGIIAELINMPLYYVSGELKSGLNATGEADNAAIERGIEAFFNSIFKPVVDEIFKTDIKFISDRWRVLLSSGAALKTIETIDPSIMPLKIKQRIAENILKDFYTDSDKLSETED